MPRKHEITPGPNSNRIALGTYWYPEKEAYLRLSVQPTSEISAEISYRNEEYPSISNPWQAFPVTVNGLLCLGQSEEETFFDEDDEYEEEFTQSVIKPVFFYIAQVNDQTTIYRTQGEENRLTQQLEYTVLSAEGDFSRPKKHANSPLDGLRTQIAREKAAFVIRDIEALPMPFDEVQARWLSVKTQMEDLILDDSDFNNCRFTKEQVRTLLEQVWLANSTVLSFQAGTVLDYVAALKKALADDPFPLWESIDTECCKTSFDGELRLDTESREKLLERKRRFFKEFMHAQVAHLNEAFDLERVPFTDTREASVSTNPSVQEVRERRSQSSSLASRSASFQNIPSLLSDETTPLIGSEEGYGDVEDESRGCFGGISAPIILGVMTAVAGMVLVVVAFLALNVMSGGVAGIVAAGVGGTMLLASGVGFFKSRCGSQEKEEATFGQELLS